MRWQAGLGRVRRSRPKLICLILATDSAHRYATARPRRAARSRFPIAEWSPQKRKCVTQITDGSGAASYIGDNRTHTLEEGEHVMTWTSDRAGVVLYTVLGMLIVLSSIYIPA